MLSPSPAPMPFLPSVFDWLQYEGFFHICTRQVIKNLWKGRSEIATSPHQKLTIQVTTIYLPVCNLCPTVFSLKHNLDEYPLSDSQPDRSLILGCGIFPLGSPPVYKNNCSARRLIASIAETCHPVCFCIMTRYWARQFHKAILESHAIARWTIPLWA